MEEMTERSKIIDAVGLAVDFGWIGGAHHKDWVIDQMVRKLQTEQEYKDLRRAIPDWEEGIAP